ncbi:MAG: CRTAC1 family protein [Deltaproteobacteria bacterium]|nr:MAG: CRTAC1 family protein [Deltaproteobacteria bacterium]
MWIAAMLVALSGCSGDGQDTGPTVICNSSSAWTGGAAFSDETTAWGLADVRGVKMSTADLNGDGYPDLIVNEGTPHSRDDLSAGVRYHWLLMNEDDGSGHRTFVDRSEESGLWALRPGTEDGGGDFRASQVHVMGDVDNDGDLDVFAGAFTDANHPETDLGDRSELMINDGTGHFSFGTDHLQVSGGYSTSGASFADVDADGDLDLWVTGWYEQYGAIYAEQDRLYVNNGVGDFGEWTSQAGLEMERGSGSSLDPWLEGTARRPAYGATACDLNGDAMPDLLASNYGRSWNQQWMNQGNGTFVDTGRESGFAGDDDLSYVEDQFYACYCEVYGPCDPDPGPPRLAGCETYAEYWTPGFDDQPARLNGNSFTTACGDIDNDGDNDLITAEIVHWHIGRGSDPTELLINDGSGVFTRPGNDTNGLARDWPSADWNAGDLYVAMVDIDNDMLQDILLISSDYPDTRLFLFRQVEPGRFTEVAEEMGIAHPWPAGMAVADFDRDGDLDVITGSSTARSGTPWDSHELHFYENQLGPGNSVRIRLEGTAANKAGIGARVAVTAGGVTQTREVSGGFGHFGIQNDTALVFGLGDACTIDAVEVTWPGGATDRFDGVLPNQSVTLVQGGEVRVEGDAGGD